MKKKFVSLIFVGLVLLIVGLSGLGHVCLSFPGSSQWELEVWVSNTEKLEEETVLIEGEVALSGHTTGTTVKGISIVFENENMSQDIRIGSLSGYSEKSFTIRLHYMPDVILTNIGVIQTGDDSEYWIKGLQRTDSGDYEPFVQRKNRC